MHYTDESDGTLYGFMFDSDSRGLYWRKDLFEEVGLDPEVPPKTWSELRMMAEKLTIKSGDFYERIGFIPTYGQGFHWGYMGQAGGWPPLDWSTIPPQWRLNTPESVSAMQFMVDATDDYGGMSSVQTFQEGFQSAADEPFFTGQIAMMINGVWKLDSIKRYAPDLQYGVTNEPIADSGGKKATLSGGWGWAIPVGSLHPFEAFDLMSWFWEDEQLLFWNVETAHIPPKKSVGADPAFQEGNFAFFTEAMSWNGGWPAGPWTQAPGYTTGNAQDDALLHNKTPQEALDLAQAEYQAIADDYYS
jgi:multiple sugar transport system permease protein